jgi:predicted Zn finger-like uncharacterized protein
MSTKVQAVCPSCGKRYSVTDSMTGRRLRCKQCGTAFAVPDGAPSAPSPSPAETPPAGPESARATTEGGDTRPEAPSPVHSVPAEAPSPVHAVPAEVPATIGPYEVHQKLGEGAFGVVYHGYHPFLRREVAVKVLRAEALASARAVERFEREAQVLAQMNHPNVPRVYDAGKHGNDYYIASDFIAGQDLAEAIPEGGLEPQRAIRLTLQLLAALAYAHGLGIVHRDVKPHNARLTAEGTLFLTDFGLAGWAAVEEASAGVDSRKLTQEGVILGTPAYMAPEQADGLVGKAGPQADLYSAGVVLYEMLTDELPLEGENAFALLWAKIHLEPKPPSQFRPGLDPGLDAICLKALARRPEDRYRTADEFAAALECWVGAQARAVVRVEPPVAVPAPAPPAGKTQPIPVQPIPAKPIPVQPVPVRPTPKPAGQAPAPLEALPAGRPARPTSRRRLHCFNHDDAPAVHRCVDCGEPFCAACLVLLQKKTVCGPCKDFRLRLLERPPRTSGLAILALVLGLAGTSFGICLTALQQSAHPQAWTRAVVLGALGLCAPLLTFMTGADALRAIARTTKLHGHALAIVGMAVAGLGTLWCLGVIVSALPACWGN